MDMQPPIVNRIAKSRLVVLDPGKHYPTDLLMFDLKPYLFQGLVLKESDFRQAMDLLDIESYRDKKIVVHCSTDAIIPVWAYMLVASKLGPVAQAVYQGPADPVITTVIVEACKASLSDVKIMNGLFIIKGCSDYKISPDVHVRLTTYLMSEGAKSIMFGEPCSTVPIYKKSKSS